eukprot:1317233-Rhodomonas_salina.3
MSPRFEFQVQDGDVRAPLSATLSATLYATLIYLLCYLLLRRTCYTTCYPVRLRSSYGVSGTDLGCASGRQVNGTKLIGRTFVSPESCLTRKGCVFAISEIQSKNTIEPALGARVSRRRRGGARLDLLLLSGHSTLGPRT